MPIMGLAERAAMDRRMMLLLEHRMTYFGNQYGDLDKLMDRMVNRSFTIAKNENIDNISKKMDDLIEKQEVVNSRMNSICRRYVLRYGKDGITYTMKGDPNVSFFISNEDADMGFRHSKCGVKHVCN